MIRIGPATPAAPHAVSSTPCTAPTLRAPNRSAKNAGIVANPPPYIVKITTTAAWNRCHCPARASIGIAANSPACAAKKIMNTVLRPIRSDSDDQKIRPNALNPAMIDTITAASSGVFPNRSCIIGDACARIEIPAPMLMNSIPHSSQNWRVRTAIGIVSSPAVMAFGTCPSGLHPSGGRARICAAAIITVKYTAPRIHSAGATPYAWISRSSTGAAINAPPPKPSTAIPVASPRRSGNHFTSALTGDTYASPSPAPPTIP